MTIVAGNGSSGYVDGPGQMAEFDGPQALALDPQGNLIVTEESNPRIRRIDTAGNVTTLAGNGQHGDADGTGGVNGTAQFISPQGVAVDDVCNVYVADRFANRIRQISFGAPPP